MSKSEEEEGYVWNVRIALLITGSFSEGHHRETQTLYKIVSNRQDQCVLCLCALF